MTTTSLADEDGRRDHAAWKAPNEAAYRGRERNETTVLAALAVPGLLLIGAIALTPIAWLFWLSFRSGSDFTFEHYERLLHPTYTLTLQTTFELSFLVTAICIALGYPLAYLISQVRPRLAAFLLLLVLFPVWTSLLVRCYAWLVLLQRRGVVNSWLQDMGVIEAPLRLMHNFTGTTIGMVHIMLPFMVLPLLRHHALHQPRLHAPRRTRRLAGRHSGTCSCRPRFRSLRRHHHRLRAVPRLLCDAGAAGRRARDDVVDADRA
jgi:hypothetical protein